MSKFRLSSLGSSRDSPALRGEQVQRLSGGGGGGGAGGGGGGTCSTSIALGVLAKGLFNTRGPFQQQLFGVDKTLVTC